MNKNSYFMAYFILLLSFCVLDIQKNTADKFIYLFCEHVSMRIVCHKVLSITYKNSALFYLPCVHLKNLNGFSIQIETGHPLSTSLVSLLIKSWPALFLSCRSLCLFVLYAGDTRRHLAAQKVTSKDQSLVPIIVYLRASR
jgi:hypothetical protein